MAVLIDVSQLWPPSRVRWGTDTPMWARSKGVRVNELVPGVLLEWVVTACGDWCGLCRFVVQAAGEDLTLTQLVPQAALQQRVAG